MKDDFFCELYADTFSGVFDDSDNAILDGDSDVPTTDLQNLLHSAIVFSSDSETSTEVEDNGELESSDD